MRLDLRIGLWILASLLTSAQTSFAAPGSVEFFQNDPQDFDYAAQVELPGAFGQGEFTFEMWVRLNDSLPVGPTLGGLEQLRNWSDSDEAPYSSNSWWFHGNFLIDGHNNNVFQNGTFSLQVYGGGRIRWLFGDGVRQTGGPWAIQAFPASSTPSLLDGQWHQITLVRRWSGTSEALLELWIDGAQVASETSTSRTNMATSFWNGWTGYPNNEEGWFYAAEKGAAIGSLGQWEDYKGLIDEIRFWNRAKSANEISSGYSASVVGNEPALEGVYRFGEAQGSVSCDSIDPGRCIFLTNAQANVWSPIEAPIGGGSDATPPTVPTGLQGTAVSDTRIDLSWNASSDNVVVTGYEIRRDGALVGTSSQTSFSDTGLSASTSYAYTVAARDGAGNTSAESTSVVVTTLSNSDTEPPSSPTNVQGTAVSATAIDITWTAATDNVGVSSYEVHRDGSLVGTTMQTQFRDSGLTQNTTYNYFVVARDAAGNTSPQSNTISITTQTSSDSEPPSVPTALQGSALSTSSIRITWTASTDNVAVSGYDVLRNGTLVGSTSTTSYTDSGLNAGTSYTYAVIARDTAGNASAASSSISVSTRSASTGQGSGGGGSLSPLLQFLLMLILVATRRMRLAATDE